MHIVRSRKLLCLSALLAVAPAASVLADPSAEDAALRTRRSERLLKEEPDRARIERSEPGLLSKGQDVPGVLDVDEEGRPKKVAVSVSLSEIAAAAKPKGKIEPGILDFWVEGRIQNYTATTASGSASDGNMGVLYLGSSVKVTADIMVGALAQLDCADETLAASRDALTANGWMAGPFLSMRLAPGLVFDGRAAWGASAVGGPFVEGDRAENRLVRAKLTGTREVSGWQVAPSVGLSYIEDIKVTDGIAAPGTGRVDVLPQVSRKFEIDQGTYIEPRLAVGGFVAFDDPSQIATGGAPDVRAKAEAGFELGAEDGTKLQATGGVETGGDSAKDNWSTRLQLNMPLNK